MIRDGISLYSSRIVHIISFNIPAQITGLPSQLLHNGRTFALMTLPDVIYHKLYKDPMHLKKKKSLLILLHSF